MSATEPTLPPPTRAAVILAPYPGVDDHRFDLRWTVEVAGGPTTASVAGIATLTTPTGSELWFDYADPRRFLGLALDGGQVTDREDLNGIDELVSQASISDVDEALVRLLLGPDALPALTGTTSGELTLVPFEAVDETVRILGRLAVMETHLRDRRHPISGFWALESAADLAALATDGPIGAWAREELARSHPLLDHLPLEWAASLRADRYLEDRMRAVLAWCQELEPDGAFGPAGDQILQDLGEEIQGALDDLDFMLAVNDLAPPRLKTLGRSLSLSSDGDGDGDDQRVRSAGARAPEQRAEVFIDPQIQRWIGDVRFAVEGDGLALGIAPAEGSARTATRAPLSVRVTDAAGTLVGSRDAVALSNDGDLETLIELAAPRATGTLTVYIGLDLDLAPIDREAARTLVLRALARRAVEFERLTGSIQGRNAARREARTRMDGLAGRPIRWDPAETRPHLAELIQRSDQPPSIEPTPTDGPDRLAAAVELALTLGDDARAGSLFIDYIDRGGDPDRFPPETLDVFILELDHKGHGTLADTVRAIRDHLTWD